MQTAEVIQDLGAKAEAAVRAIAGGTEKAWPVLVEETQRAAMVEAGGCLLFVVAGIACLVAARKLIRTGGEVRAAARKVNEYDCLSGDGYDIAGSAVGVAGIVGIGLGLSLAIVAAKVAAAPNLALVEKILSALK